jgi:hypothetical protein
MLTTEAIREIVTPIAKKYDVARVDLFGSYADGTATPKSDVDFLIEFAPESKPSLFTLAGFWEELKRSLGLDVDVVKLPLQNPRRLSINKTVRIV